MIVSLNLIPESYKLHLRKREFFVSLQNTVFTLLVSFTLVATLLLAGQTVMQNQAISIINETSLVPPGGNNSLQATIRTVNEKINAATKIETSNYAWAQLIADFNNHIPKGISLNSETLSPDVILLDGNADTRDHLLELQTTLEQVSYVNGVDLPISYLLTRQNIPFTLQVKLNRQKLPQ